MFETIVFSDICDIIHYHSQHNFPAYIDYVRNQIYQEKTFTSLMYGRRGSALRSRERGTLSACVGSPAGKTTCISPPSSTASRSRLSASGCRSCPSCCCRSSGSRASKCSLR